MNEEPTKELTNFEQRVLAEFAQLNRRMTTLEERMTVLEDKVERRLHDTRPMWEVVIVQLREVKEGIAKLVVGLRELNRDMLETRTRVGVLEDRERTPAA